MSWLDRLLARIPRRTISEPKAWLGVLPGYALVVGAVWLPQLVASHDMIALAVLVAIAITLLWIGLAVILGASSQRGLIGAGIGVVDIVLMHAFGSGAFQSALALGRGHSLDGVTLDDARARREDGIWVRLVDARVRSEATENFHYTSGGGRDAKGAVQATQLSTVSVAPVTLAAAVSHEETMMRRAPAGEVWLWACATNTFMLSDWDRERQAVRGWLAPMKDNVVQSLRGELRTAVPMPIPGAGAIPAAPGATTPTLVVEHAGMTLPAEPWCVELDRALDVTAATEQLQSTALAIGLSVPFFVVLFAFLVARTRP